MNLHLEVLGRRPDGYHELRTIFAAVGVWDELIARGGAGGDVRADVVPAGAAPAGDDNLVVRAVRALAGNRRRRLRGAHDAAQGDPGGRRARRRLGGRRRGARRRSPVSGEPTASPNGLVALAADLGADVPFFLVGGVAWGVGRGSDVTPLPDLPPWWVVLLPGPAPISTAEVYRAARRERGGRRHGL